VTSLDKTSVREKVNRLKADFARLCSEGKVSSEIQAIMNSLFLIIELILAIFLERSTKKDGKNSSIPSSQTEKDESTLSHPGSNDKGKSENKDQARNTRVKETVTISQVLTCDVCTQDLVKRIFNSKKKLVFYRRQRPHKIAILLQTWQSYLAGAASA
jgi:transposase